jgi:hypothetical protein
MIGHSHDAEAIDRPASRARAGGGVIALALCALGVLSAEFSAGCGYALAGRGSFLPAHIRSIGVPTFTNRTSVFNLESLLTERVRAEFIGRSKYQILPQRTGVDAVLVGDIASVTVTPASFSSQQLASRYLIMMSVSIQLRDLRDDKVLWENPSLLFREEYDATAGRSVVDPIAFFGQEANALDRVSGEFARAIVSAILEAF